MSNIVFDDLPAPVLDEAQRRLLDEAERNPVRLDPDRALAAAAETTGLDDFGADDFRERLALLFAEVAADANATELARRSLWNRCVEALENRLLVVDLLRRHPEIQDVEIERPIVIAGLPRSGTTHLLELVAQHPAVRSLPYWEVLRPVPLPGENDAHRLARVEAQWKVGRQLNPHSLAFHSKDPHHISEDGDLQVPDFASYVWEWRNSVPGWRDYYFAHDQTPHYAFEKTMLKVLEWRSGEKRRWVVKSPQHFEQLGPIMEVFPDALVVFTHRDPLASLASIATMKAYEQRTRERRPEPAAVLAYWSDRVERLLEAYVRDVHVVPDQQRFDVPFGAFVEDDVAMVSRLYETAGLPGTDAVLANLRRFASKRGRGRHGTIDNDLKRNFGVDPADVRRRFAFYTDFSVG